MSETRTDKYGRLLCARGNIWTRTECETEPLAFIGPWIYHNGDHPSGIQPGKYTFRCTFCSMGYVADVEETKRHFTGERLARMQKEIDTAVKELAT